MRAEFSYTSGRVPAPFVPVTVGVIPGTATVAGLPALVDSGADRTLVPERVVAQLGAAEITRLEFEVGGGEVISLPVFRVTLAVAGFPAVVADVAVSAGEENVLLGRDVLNLFAVLLDGPNGTIGIRDE